MQLAILGVNHNTASVEMRECLALGETELQDLYNIIMANDRIYETMILSTCNRVEYYIVTDDYLCNIESVVDAVAAYRGIDKAEFRKHTYMHCDTEALEHIFRVAGGLDSLVLGEPQIFGQVKDAFEQSRSFGGMNTYMRKLEEHVIKTTKKIRTNTGIGDNAVSVSYAAVELAGKVFGNLNKKTALIIGAGEMCELAAKHLQTAGVKKIIVTNRTPEKAERLANEVGGETAPFESFTERMVEADIVISSTGAPDYVVRYEGLKGVASAKKHNPMFFIDIAVPRDIDPKINDIENMYVYDIDDLKAVVEANRKLREKEAVKAMDYVRGGVESFCRWLESMKIVPVVKGMRGFFEEVRDSELERFFDKMKITSEDEKRKFEHLLNSYMNKALHKPTTNLKNKCNGRDKYTISESVKIIFDIKD